MSTKHGVPAFLASKRTTHFLLYDLPTTSTLGYVEGGQPTEIADRLGASVPYHLACVLLQRVVKMIAAADK